MIVITFCLLLFLAAITLGIFAGRATERPRLHRDFWIGLVITNIVALLFLGMALWHIAPLQEWLNTQLTKSSIGLVEHISPLLLSGMTIPDFISRYLTIACALFSLSLYLLAFNCRRRVDNWYISCSYLLLFYLIFHFGAIWGYYGISTLILLFSKYSDRFPTLQSMVVLLILLVGLLLCWTWFALRNAKKGWRRLMVHAGIFASSFVGCWLLALSVVWPYGSSLDRKAAKLNIVPLNIESGFPQKLHKEQQKIEHFREKHPLLAIPLETIHDWQVRPENKKQLPDAERAYTLNMFDSQEMEEFLVVHETLLNEIFSQKDTVYFSAMNLARSYARLRCGKAALYYETKQPEKILPEFQKIAQLEAELLGDSPSKLGELVHLAVRFMSISHLITLGPNDVKYAPIYREFLDESKKQPVRVLEEQGLYLSVLESALKFQHTPLEQALQTSNSYAVFLSTPPRIATAARGLSAAFAREKIVQELAQQESFTLPLPDSDPILETSIHLLLRSRISLSLLTTGLALKLYRVETGHYPEKLNELVPNYLEKLSPCPYTGEPLLYESDGTNFTLSVTDPEQKARHRLDSRPNY